MLFVETKTVIIIVLYQKFCNEEYLNVISKYPRVKVILFITVKTDMTSV